MIPYGIPYADGEFYHFMMTDGFLSNTSSKSCRRCIVKWLKEQETYIVTLFNGAPLAVTPPNHIELEVVETDPGLKGDTAQGGSSLRHHQQAPL